MATFQEIAYNFTGDATDLHATLRAIEKHAKQVAGRKQSINLEAKTDRARKELNKLEDRLEELDRSSSDIEITANVKKLVAQIALARQIIARMPDKKTVTVEIQEKINRDVARVDSLVTNVIRDVTRMGRAAESAGDVMRRGLQNGSLGIMEAMGRVSVVLRRLPPLAAGVALVFTGVVTPALLAAAAAITGLVAGIGALATAMVAALGPAMVLIVGLATRLAKVMEARKEREQAEEAAVKRAAQANLEAARAEEQRHQAALRVRDSREAVARAERAVGEASRAAAQDIADARARATEAAREEAQAVASLARATAAAYREIEDAAERASDAIRDVADAELNVQEANLGLREARLDLEEFRKQAGLSKFAVDDLFQKFQDVNTNIDTSRMREEIKKAAGGDPGDANELERRLIAVRRAQLNLASAHDRVGDAEREANRAAADSNRLRKAGLSGVDSYRSAVEALAEAQRESRSAQVELRDLERQGIANAPGVIAAQESLKDAQQAFNEAVHDRARVSRELAMAQAQMAAEDVEASEAMDKLTDSEKRLVFMIDALATAYEQTLAPAVSRVFNAMLDAGERLLPVIRGAMGAMETLGGVWAEQIGKFTDVVLNPVNMIKFAGFSAAASKLSDAFGTMFTSAFQIAINVASAAMPELVSLFDDAATKIQGLASASGDVGGMRKALEPAFKMLRLIVGAVADVGAGLFNAFTAGQGPIVDFVKWIREAASSFLSWTRSEEGREQIREFFEDTLPFIKSFIGFIVRLGIAVLKVFQILLPIAKPFIDFGNAILDLLILLLRLVDWVIGPFKTAIGVALTFFLGVGRVIGLVGKGISALPRLFSGLPRRMIEIAGRVLKPFRDAWNGIRNLFTRSGVGGWISGLVSRIGGALRGVTSTITAPFRRAFNWIRDAAGRVGDFVARAWAAIPNALRSVVNVLVDAANAVIGAINKIKISIPSWVPGLGGKTLGFDLRYIPRWGFAEGGLVKGPVAGVVGEGRHHEAVLPLSSTVMSRLAAAIVSAMQVQMAPAIRGRARPAAAQQFGGGAGVHVDKIVLPPAPAGGVPDARYQAVQLGWELRRRGSGL